MFSKYLIESNKTYIEHFKFAFLCRIDAFVGRRDLNYPCFYTEPFSFCVTENYR